jgi:glyoxylase-like metal-dependent hydrolase (beta-lactamase superfamily II)
MNAQLANANYSPATPSSPRASSKPIKAYALQTGTVRVKSAQVAPTRRGLLRIAGPLLEPAWAEWLPTNAWLIDHPEGPIVVDTGSAAHLLRLPRWHPYFRLAVRFAIEPEEEVGPRLRALGLEARDVRTVVLTHMHIDHDAGLHHFPASVPVLADAREIAGAAGLRGRLLGYLPQRWPKGFDPAPLRWTGGPVGPFERTAALTQDGSVFAVPTPGHTPGHVSVVVMDGETAIVLAGDAAYTQAQMIAGWPDGVGWDAAAQAATHKRLRAFAAATPAVFLPTHDPQSAERLRTRTTVAPTSPSGSAQTR